MSNKTEEQTIPSEAMGPTWEAYYGVYHEAFVLLEQHYINLLDAKDSPTKADAMYDTGAAVGVALFQTTMRHLFFTDNPETIAAIGEGLAEAVKSGIELARKTPHP